MTKAKHTPGPWTVTHNPSWPFDIDIMPDIIQMRRVAYSTGQNSLADVRLAKGFPHKDRESVEALVSQQEANARIIAAAPDMLNALKRLDAWFDTDEELLLSMTGPERFDHERQVAMIRAAIAKATGEAKP